MAAFNVVRFRVKPGQEEAFVKFHRKARAALKGFVDGWLVKTGDRTFCFIGQWRTYQSIVKARPEMIGLLDGTRAMLEDLGNGLGVTDPVSGEAVVKLKMRAPAAKRTVSASVKAKSSKPAAGKAASKRARAS